MVNRDDSGTTKAPVAAGTPPAASWQPLISVVTVVRNGERHLAQTLASVNEQSYQNLELIVVDGDSSDATVDIIRAHEQSITRWISEPDGGIYDAMNKALAMCSGDYLYFLNCADRFMNDHTVEDVVAAIRGEAPDIVCGQVLDVHASGSVLNDFKTGSEYQLYLLTVCHQALFTARRVFETVGAFDTRYQISADREWLLRAMKRHGYRLTYIDLPVTMFDTSGVSCRQRKRLKVENLKINRRYFGWRFYPFLVRQAAAKLKRLLCGARTHTASPASPPERTSERPLAAGGSCEGHLGRTAGIGKR